MTFETTTNHAEDGPPEGEPLPTNITWCRIRQCYRVEMRVEQRKSRTRRVRSFAEALALRNEWAAERSLGQIKRAEKNAVRFNIERRHVVVVFN